VAGVGESGRFKGAMGGAGRVPTAMLLGKVSSRKALLSDEYEVDGEGGCEERGVDGSDDVRSGHKFFSTSFCSSWCVALGPWDDAEGESDLDGGMMMPLAPRGDDMMESINSVGGKGGGAVPILMMPEVVLVGNRLNPLGESDRGEDTGAVESPGTCTSEVAAGACLLMMLLFEGILERS
jgi:hypothetical protein